MLKNEQKQLKIRGKKQIKAIEDHGKQSTESNDLIKKDFNIPLEEQKNIYLITLLKKDLLNFRFKKNWRNKDFRNHQNPIELFKDLKDGNINPEEVLKYQISFKSDLKEIKKGNNKSKSQD